MSKRVDFSSNANIYDRRHGAVVADEIDEHLADLRFMREESAVIGPGSEITIREFLRRLVAGELSYVWEVPQDARDHCLPILERWSAQTFDLDRPVPMPQEVRWTVHRKMNDA